MTALNVSGISKTYHPSFPWLDRGKSNPAKALHGVSFSLQRGEICALLGPNGAGKTTLLKTFASLVLPDEGQISIFGQALSSLKTHQRAWLSLVTGEEKSFYWRLTGRQNLEFFACLYNLPPKKSRATMEDLASRLGLENLDKPYQEYSAGHRQRLAIIRSLMVGARLILMDEPTRSLDPEAADHFRSLIRSQVLTPERAIVLATHNLHEAEMLADRIAVLNHGRLLAFSSVPEIKKQGWASLEAFYQAQMRPACSS